jgi:hypothetical protein
VHKKTYLSVKFCLDDYKGNGTRLPHNVLWKRPEVTDENLNPLKYNMKESLINPDFLVIAGPSFDWLSIIQGLEME